MLGRTHARVLNIFTGHQRTRFEHVTDLLSRKALPSSRLTVEYLPARGRTAFYRIFDVSVVIDEFELQEGGLADNLLGALGILNPRKLDENIILAVALDNRFAHAELVDAVAYRFQSLVDRVIAQRTDLFFAQS